MSHKWNELSKKRYLASLSHEIRSDALHYRAPLRSIYFGGGTPSILKKSEIAHILSLCNISSETEISFECNPEDISAEYLRDLASLGINRISMGVQSLDDTVLKTIGRSGTSRDDILEKI
jgi:oxygen-independent coproporphyrinogen-3 oxidase